MTLATLTDVLHPAQKEGYAVMGAVCLGWEDMRAYIRAAEAEEAPIILQAGPGCRAHTPLPVLGKMFTYLAENTHIPVVAHLDHGYSFEECKIAIESGFSSVMFDGSRKEIHQNIDETAAIAEIAHAANVSLEGEIGFVGYAEGESSAGTSVEEAKIFARDSGVDAMAISVGNVHLQQEQATNLDEERIKQIEAVTNIPLVIHGGSGVTSAQRAHLAANSNICKFNIGTELRMAFGAALREAVNRDEKRFDRVSILKETEEPVFEAARIAIRTINKK
ncbi:MAG: class II fructose-bisphosphate aldolase [Alphaproteobacteria bacterium]|nr:class II fructose-bisphosphate aldolase [Alphaproteobacteria bacterium]